MESQILTPTGRITVVKAHICPNIIIYLLGLNDKII